MATTQDRSFVRGSTVHLRVRVSEPGSKVPATAAVVLTWLRLGAVEIPMADTAFGQIEVGDYLLVLPTVDLGPGTYDLRVAISDGPAKVSILTDRFVVTA